MKPAFHDHFSGHATAYARSRPVWPRALATRVAELAPARAVVADVGTGNGQLAGVLVDYFDVVEASDASAPQIQMAAPHERIRYRVAPATATGLPDASVDAITVGQALHWFATPEFFAEVARIARPGAIFVAASYQLFELSPAFDAAVAELYAALDPDWPPQRRHIEEGYANIGIPFESFAVSGVTMEALWTLEDTLGYLRSWSAVQRNLSRTGTDPVESRRAAFAEAWGDTEARRVVRWPLIVRAGTVRR
jgi:SAM-dependent methyltransferase